MTVVETAQRKRAASLEELEAKGRMVVGVEGNTVCLLLEGGEVHAVDNRCPHMGFPLHRGSVADGILTCHWHHARFDLCSGGTFDQWADELRRFPVEVEDGEIYVDVTPRRDPVEHQRKRLHDGLERDIALVVAKAAIVLAEADPSGADAFRDGLDFGVARRGGGWFRGLTTLTCLMNLVPRLDADERAAALYHGLADVANDSAGMEPRVPARAAARRRGRAGAARALVPRLRRGARRRGRRARARLGGALRARRRRSSPTCSSRPRPTTATSTAATRSTSSTRRSRRSTPAAGSGPRPCSRRCPRSSPSPSGWRRRTRGGTRSTSSRCSRARSSGCPRRSPRRAAAGTAAPSSSRRCSRDDPAGILEALLAALREGATEVELASAVSFAAATRIARFPTWNEFGDWDTALHTFTFANAVEQGLRRSASPELVRGVLDAAMSVYLDRFLNVPATRLPKPQGGDPEALLGELRDLLDRQQQVDEAGQLVASYLGAGGDPERLVAALGACLLREDRNFHTIQCVEAGVRQHELLSGTDEAGLPLIAAARYLAAHASTARSQRQTYEIARRLHRGERIYEDEEGLPPAA